MVKAILHSSTTFDGKTCLLRRICKNIFHGNLSLTVGLDLEKYSYKYYNKIYEIQIWDTSGLEAFRNIHINYSPKKIDILLFLFNLSVESSIDIDFLINYSIIMIKRKL